MKIYTGRGDQGQTSLFSGERQYKDSPRVTAYGTLDELNSVLGLAFSFCRNQQVKDILRSLQHQLFKAGADLATTTDKKCRIDRIKKTDWQHMEALIDELQIQIPPLKEFILPGGSPGGAFVHLARTVCRRGERELVSLIRNKLDVNPELLIYLNRLSDLLFVLARFENILEGGKEEVWQTEN
ncbi:cob(I)yrinic acid a,c-diamide adenosyltransferase [Acidobacteria bacterium AH-259-D05]|nr:cob(I)yrinic acid a,c-diamide adenosyltransferase [Acidobacteria bacterium AH-259-D05]